MEEKKAKMLKFIMGKGHQPSAERLKVQKELFGFTRVSVFTIFISICRNVNLFSATLYHFLSRLDIDEVHNEYVLLKLFSNRHFP